MNNAPGRSWATTVPAGWQPAGVPDRNKLVRERSSAVDFPTMNALELKIPPPVVLLVSALAMWLVARWLPQWSWPSTALAVLGGVLAVAGIALIGAAMLTFRRSRTTINPLKPGESAVVVRHGVFAVTRNPMYAGLAMILTGWACYLASAVAWLGVPLCIAYITRFQIIPEERILLGKFGAPFAQYLAQVRRWI
jgi:protein-S-isoprenylcysteine O-methyltransferase Ste14